MKKSELTLPEIALIAGTRGMIGAGAGLLLADRLNDDQRKAIGWTLLIIGAISTIPLEAIAQLVCRKAYGADSATYSPRYCFPPLCRLLEKLAACRVSGHLLASDTQTDRVAFSTIDTLSLVIRK